MARHLFRNARPSSEPSNVPGVPSSGPDPKPRRPSDTCGAVFPFYAEMGQVPTTPEAVRALLYRLFSTHAGFMQQDFERSGTARAEVLALKNNMEAIADAAVQLPDDDRRLVALAHAYERL